jgi:hypothetical protein
VSAPETLHQRAQRLHAELAQLARDVRTLAVSTITDALEYGTLSRAEVYADQATNAAWSAVCTLSHSRAPGAS